MFLSNSCINRVYIKVQTLLISKDFSPSKKTTDFTGFFPQNFRKLGSILRVFFYLKMVEMGPSSKDVFDHIVTHV